VNGGGVRKTRPRVGVPNSDGQYQYGIVIGTIREALLASAGVGLSFEDMIAYCKDRNIDVTVSTVRDTVKRLKGGDEVTRINRTYYPGPRLRTTDTTRVAPARKPPREPGAFEDLEAEPIETRP
jgi:hypothetical protein